MKANEFEKRRVFTAADRKDRQSGRLATRLSGPS